MRYRLPCFQGKRKGFRILRFNAAVEPNIPQDTLRATGLFPVRGILSGFRRKDGRFENTDPCYQELLQVQMDLSAIYFCISSELSLRTCVFAYSLYWPAV